MLDIQIYNMRCGYTLEWLDSLITNSLNLAKTERELHAIAPEQIRLLKSKIEEEKIKHQSFLNNQVFLLLEEEKIEVLINQYYATLIFLRHQALHDKTSILNRHPMLKEVQWTLIQSMEELTSFLENRFPEYLNPAQKASGLHLQAIKKELKSLLASFWPLVENKVGEKPLTDIVLNTFQTLLDNIKKEAPVSLSEVSYLKALLKELKGFSGLDSNACKAEGLNEILISLNFNHPVYIHYFTQSITAQVKAIGDIADQLEKLLFLRKSFYQINSKPGIAFYPAEKDLRTIIGNWFNQEIKFLERKQQLKLASPQVSANSTKQLQQESLKIVSCLSVDQMSLILRAADDLRIIKARSLNAVFKQIVPHLSTSSKENISFDSMRSKAYAVEEKDKKIVIHTLEQMIKKIKEY
jgi:hypothetical protein